MNVYDVRVTTQAQEQIRDIMKDVSGLSAAIKTTYEKVATLPDPADEAKSEYIKTSAGKSISAFMEAITANAEKPRLSTGFKAIDEVLF